MFERLFTPVSDVKLKRIVHFTFGFVFLTVLLQAGVFNGLSDSVLARQAFVAATGVLVCLSLCKTLFHEKMPATYIRYGCYVMALGYALFIIGG